MSEQPTPRELAEEAAREWDIDRGRFYDADLVEHIERAITKALAACEARAYEEAAKVCDDLPTDKARCKELYMTTQAWEEASDACAKAIRSLAAAQRKEK